MNTSRISGQTNPRSSGLEISKWSSPDSKSSKRKSSNPETPRSKKVKKEPLDAEAEDDRGRKRDKTTSTSMKRGSSEYLTKEHGTIANPDAAEEKPKMATAAQQARRKIIQPKSRARGTTPTGTSSFGGSQSSQLQLGGPANNNTSQSFPPPAQSQAFNFNVPSSSSSFTFGTQQNGGAQPLTNPFANMNGANTTTSGNDNAMMDSSPQKPASTAGLFSGFAPSTNQAAPSTNGFSFGQSTQQPSTTSSFGSGFGGGSLFGQKPQEPATTSSLSLFGAQPSPTSQPQTNGFFGTTTSAPPNPFGNTASSGSLFGGFGDTSTAEATPSTTAATTQAPTWKFGETSVVDTKSNSPQPTESTTPKAKPAFSFGQTTSFGQPAVDKAPASEPPKIPNIFGQPAATSTADSQSTPSKPLFGLGPSNSTTPTAPATEPAKPNFTFGSAVPSVGGSVGAMQVTPSSFGAAQNKPTEAMSSGTLFGRVSSDVRMESAPRKESSQETTQADPVEDQGSKNPFAGLFASAKSEAPAVSDTAKTTKPQPLFGQTATSTSKPAETPSANNNLFAKSPATDTQSTMKAQSTFFPASSPRQAPSSGGLFSPKPSTPTASAPLFGNLNKSTTAATESSSQDTTPQKSTSTMFGSNTANAGSTPFKFGQTSQSKLQEEDGQPAKKRLFASPSAHNNMAKAAGVEVAGPSEPVQPMFTQPQRPAPAPQEVNRAVSTEGPPQIPRYLSADKYKSYDENWRLKALNRHFQRFVGSINVNTHDLASVVQNYLDHREAIGEGLSQFMRVQTAGSKRKAIDVDDMQDDEPRNKKTNTQTAPLSGFGSVAKPTAAPANIFGSVPSPKPAAPSSPRKADSYTSNIFKSMIPGAAGTTSAAPAKSTTPPSSPPKTSAPQLPKFELPKFGGSSTNFANAFAAQASKSAEVLKKTSAEKRKAEEFDSDEDDEEEWSKKYEEEQAAKRAKIEAASKGAFGFVPSASTSRSNSPFVSAPQQSDAGSRSNSPFTFGKPSTTNTGKTTPGDSETAAISIESDGDGHVEHTGSTTDSSHNESGNSGDDEDEEPDDMAEDGGEDENEEEGEPIPDLPKGQSLFDRISKPVTSTPQQEKGDEPILQSAGKDYYKPSVMFGHVGKSTPEQPIFSPVTPATAVPKTDFVPTTTFQFNTSKPSSSFGDANSVFGGGAMKDGPIPGEGLFGSRPSTPQPGNAEKPASSVFGYSITHKAPSGSDNTWTKGSPIKFGESTSSKDTSAPSIEVSSATPPAKETTKPLFGSLGGNTKPTGFFGAATSNGASVGFNFGAPATQDTKPAPGFLSATSHLGGGLSSGISSRGSSPGIPSEAESTADEADNEHGNQPQLDLKTAAAGEEDEDVLFETRSVLSRYYQAKDLEAMAPSKLVEGWNKIGNGTMKVLKHKETGKPRIVFRVDPNANILLNTRLLPVPYTGQVAGKQGAMFFVANFLDGKTAKASLRVSTLEKAEELASICEANKAA